MNNQKGNNYKEDPVAKSSWMTSKVAITSVIAVTSTVLLFGGVLYTKNNSLKEESKQTVELSNLFDNPDVIKLSTKKPVTLDWKEKIGDKEDDVFDKEGNNGPSSFIEKHLLAGVPLGLNGDTTPSRRVLPTEFNVVSRGSFERLLDRDPYSTEKLNDMLSKPNADVLLERSDMTRGELTEQEKEELRLWEFTEQKIKEAKEYSEQREKDKASGRYSVVTDEQTLRKFEVPNVDSSFKTYMDYTKITNVSSKQYKIQKLPNVYTDEEGFRRYNNDYIIALGTYYGKQVGARMKITLSSGKQFTALVGDIKDDRNTDSKRQHKNGNIVEFVVDTTKMDSDVKLSGNMSTAKGAGLVGKVVSIELIGYIDE